jgi:hypothetical protein
MKTREFCRKSEFSFHLLFVLGPVAMLALSTPHGLAQGTAFTYQGRLNDNGAPATGIYDLRFAIYDLPGAGNAVSGQLNRSGVPVTNGLFTVTLDFGAGIFTGLARWLEIGVRQAGAGNFTTLIPRQAITPAPYAIFAANAVGGGTGPWSLNGANAYYNGGNVGIGINTPAEKLTIAGVSSYNNGLKLTGNADAGTGLALENTSFGGHKYALLSGGVADGIGVGAFGIFDDTIGSYRLSISPGGNVGIGTPTPASPLTVLSPAYGIEHTDGAIRLGTFVGAGAGWLGTINNFPLSFFVNGGGAILTLDTGGWIQANESLSINGVPWYDSPLTLHAKGARTALMIFDSNNYEALSMNLSPHRLRVAGDAEKSSGGTSWGVFSDRRVKKDVRDYENGLNEVLKLRPVRFHYRDDPKRGLNSVNEEVGFIAQEVREVIPDAITEGKDGYLSLKADPIHWAAINAIRELNAMLEAQRAENAGLRQRLERLEQLMNDQSVVKGDGR